MTDCKMFDLRSVLRWLWPGDTLKYYENYFRACDLVAPDPENVRPHFQMLVKIYVIIGILLTKAVHLIFMSLYEMTDLGHLIHYNVFYFLAPKIATQLNLSLAISGIACARYYYIFYFTVDPKLNTIVRDVLVNGRSSFLLCSQVEMEKIALVIRVFASKMLKYLRFLLLFADIFAVYSRLIVSFHLVKHRRDFFPSILFGALYLSINWTSALLFAVFLLYLLNICIMILSIQAVLLRLYYIKINQLNAFLAGLIRCFNWSTFKAFRSYYTQTLVSIFQTNEVYSKTLLIHFTVSWCINLYFVCSFLLFKEKTVEVYFLAILAANQFLCIALFNGMWAHFNEHIQKPSKKLYHLAIVNHHKMGDFTSRLLLINYIFSMNTRKFYGFTYGNLGCIISMKKYVKVLFLYIVVVSLVYNLFKLKFLY